MNIKTFMAAAVAALTVAACSETPETVDVPVNETAEAAATEAANADVAVDGEVVEEAPATEAAK